MSKKKIIIISVILFVVVIAGLLIIGLRNVNNEDKVKEVEIVDEDEYTSQPSTNKKDTDENATTTDKSKEVEDVEMTPISEEEYEAALLEERLYENRQYGMSPSYKFKSDDFETIPKDDDWYTNVLYAVSGDSELYKNVENVEVYNLKETKTNFIILTIEGDTYIYQMYKDEALEELVYREFDTYNNDDTFVKIIREKGKKLYKNSNPKGLDLGNW